jgi:adenylate cyclase
LCLFYVAFVAEKRRLRKTFAFCVPADSAYFKDRIAQQIDSHADNRWILASKSATAMINRIADFFSSLEIKFKLSIVIIIIVVATLVAFSLLILQSAKGVITEATNNTCTVLLQNLSRTAQDPLLLSVNDPLQIPEIQRQVLSLMRKDYPGLEYAFVIDRSGTMIAHSIPNEAGRSVPPGEMDELLNLEDVAMRVNDASILYYYPIRALKKDEQRFIPLGVAGLAFSKQELSRPISKTKNLILTTAALIIIISVWGIYFSSQKMVNEIHLLSRAARAVGSGNLDVSVAVNSKDELGQLANEFNSMVMHLREKLQMQKFVSKLTVQMIQARGGSRVVPQEGERRSVTILFSDIRNFTTIAERLEPEQIVELINIYFDVQTQIIEANRGVVDKFMGDQIMSIFQGPSMIVNATRAAVEIQRAVSALNKQREAMGAATLELGIGINQGSAVMGNMGSKQRMDYTVIGDVVNIAARLCSVARGSQIIAELGTARQLNGNYSTILLEPIFVKGRTKAVEICEVNYERDIII